MLSWSGLWRTGGGCAWSTRQGERGHEGRGSRGEGHRGTGEGVGTGGVGDGKGRGGVLNRKFRNTEKEKQLEGLRGEAEKGKELEVQPGL